MAKKIYFVTVVLFIILALALPGPASAQQKKRFFGIATGGVGGVYYPLGGALAQALTNKIPDMVVTAQTGFTPVITLELLATGSLGSKPGDPKSGVHNPEAFNADDFVALMPAYEFPGGLLEMDSEYKVAKDRQALLDLAK